MNTWGVEMTIDGIAGDISLVTSKEVITAFFEKLVKDIDMVSFGPLWIERFATHDETKSGFSAFQMIETSNICGHFVEGDGSFYLNIFSCKDFEPTAVLQLVDKFFQCKLPTNVKFNGRDAKRIV